MNVLVLNCGSSSVKFQLIEVAGGNAATDRDGKLVSGLIDRLGDQAAQPEEKLAATNHEIAVRAIIERLGFSVSGGPSERRIDAVGHRVVHGGDLFTAAVAIDDDVLARIESLDDLAPLHNPAAVSGIHAARKIFGAAAPTAAVFDTAFHHTIPEIAGTYAIPYD